MWTRRRFRRAALRGAFWMALLVLSLCLAAVSPTILAFIVLLGLTLGRGGRRFS